MHPSDYVKRLLHSFALLSLAYAISAGSVRAQTAQTTLDLRSLVRDVCREQVQMLQRRDSRLRYRIQRVDRKGTTLRDQIESHDGGVARLLRHNGDVLTLAEDEGERQRLQDLLGSNKLQQRENDEAKNRRYGVELLQAMPDAMRFVPAAQQVPLADVADQQIVVDFEPDPAFHPASMAQEVLPALRGRLWITSNDHHLLRMELHNTSDVNLAWGLLAKVYSGGSVTYDQRRFQDLYTFTHILMHLRVRELMVKTASVDTDATATAFTRLGTSPSGDDAIKMLLGEAVPTR